MVLVINKCDLFWPHTELHELAATLNAKCPFDVTLIVSAKLWRRVDKLKGYLLSRIGSTVSAKAAERYSRKWRFEGHRKSECPSIKCNRCGGKGHMSFVCDKEPEKKKTGGSGHGGSSGSKDAGWSVKGKGKGKGKGNKGGKGGKGHGGW